MTRTTAVVLLLFALAGCGQQDSAGTPAATPASTAPPSSASASPSASAEPRSPRPTGPPCQQVWSAGAKLPGGFKGCVEGGEFVRAEPRYCESGQRLFTHRDRFYAVAGGRISRTSGPLLRDTGYRQVLAVCTA